MVGTVRAVTVRQVLPEGVAQLAPGPELGVLLAGVDLHALTGSDLVEVMRARARKLSHEQAQLLAAMAEAGLCDPAAGAEEVARLAAPPEWAADEIRAALAWTRTAAYREYHFAQALLVRLPAVFAALNTGLICRSKAWLFTELCAELTDEQALVVCARLLPEARGLTTGELAARIKKLAIALDPQWAARRYATAVRDRDVIGYLDQDGTATVTGRRLPVEQATAACARIEDLAKAAKRAGHPGRIGPLRADVYLGLLEGRWQHRTRDEIIADLLADTCAQPTPDPSSPPPDTPIPPPTPDSAGGAADVPAAPDEVAREGDRQRVGVEVRVGLSTVLGLDRHPAEIPGWGPVTAEVARSVVAGQHSGEWRYAITDAEGQLLLAGITRRRPTAAAGGGPETGPSCRGGIVELHLPATLLTGLAADPGTSGPWAAAISDLAAQYATHRTRTAPAGVSRQNPAARFAGVVLRRHVQIRDRTCVHPGCRCPARHADLDHTRDHTQGGTTTETNTGPLCGHDHQLKHEAGWRLTQPRPGHFVWTSPLGQTYHTPTHHHRPTRPATRPRVSRPPTTTHAPRGRPDPAPATGRTGPSTPTGGDRQPRRTTPLLNAPHHSGRCPATGRSAMRCGRPRHAALLAQFRPRTVASSRTSCGAAQGGQLAGQITAGRVATGGGRLLQQCEVVPNRYRA